MITTKQFRLVKVTDNNPKGEIVGYIRINGDKKENGEHYFAQTWLTTTNGVQYEFDVHYISFTHLEQLAPFKDKDGGELYEGDCITAEDCEWGCSFDGTLCYDELLGWSIETDTDVVADYVNMMHLINITKLGTIHDKEF